VCVRVCVRELGVRDLLALVSVVSVCQGMSGGAAWGALARC